MTARRGLRVAVLVGGAAMLMVLLAAWGRAHWRGRQALDEGNRAFALGDHPSAVAGWAESVRWDAPLGWYAQQGADRLRWLGSYADIVGDRDLAALAWQQLASAVRATSAGGAADVEAERRAFLAREARPGSVSAPVVMRPRSGWRLAGFALAVGAWLAAAVMAVSAVARGAARRTWMLPAAVSAAAATVMVLILGGHVGG